MYEDMVQTYKDKVEYVPGGATQNTIRVAQWLIGVPNATTFMGCIGKDKFGQILEEKAREGGVNTCYMYNDTEPTGTCAVLLSGANRSLVAYLAAANHFKRAHIDKPENRALLEKANYYYMSGFPLTVCPEAMLDAAQHSSANDKIFCMNLSAPFLCSVFREPMMKLLPYVDVLFGNEAEAAEFSKANDLGLTDMKEIAIRMARYPKENGKKGRVVVLTQGPDPTIVVQEGVVTEFQVIHIDPKDIVDTNGAGDAFVGGFLAQLVQGGGIEDCIRAANYAANLIIQRSGCTLPPQPTFTVGVF